MWEIELFLKDNGRCPVQDFLADLNPKKDIPYIENAMRQLEEHGYKLPRPKAAPLEDGIYELRIKTINGNFRILYYFFDKNKIVMTNGFKKKSGPVASTHLITAKEYRKKYNERMQK